MTPLLLVTTAGFDTAAPERVLQKVVVFSHCCQDGSRTRALRIMSPLLYPLSYLCAQDGSRTRASGGSLLRSTSELPVRAVTDPSLEPVHGTQSQQRVVRRRPGLVIARNKKPLQSRDRRGSDRNSIYLSTLRSREFSHCAVKPRGDAELIFSQCNHGEAEIRGTGFACQ